MSHTMTAYDNPYMPRVSVDTDCTLALSMVKCPECRTYMRTNHRGFFRCRCGHAEYKDVSRYADLRYRIYRRRKMGSATHRNWNE